MICDCGEFINDKGLCKKCHSDVIEELETTKNLLDQANREIIGMVQIFSNQKQELETTKKQLDEAVRHMTITLLDDATSDQFCEAQEFLAKLSKEEEYEVSK